MTQRGQIEFQFAFNDGTVGNPSAGGDAFRDTAPVTAGAKASHRDGPLSHCIDFTVGADQRRYQQHAASQISRVPKRADDHIHARALASEGRQVARHHDSGDVLRIEVCSAGINPHAFKHGFKALTREGRVSEPIAGAIEADDEAVTDEHIVAYAFDVGEVLDPREGKCRRRQCERGQQTKGESQAGSPD